MKSPERADGVEAELLVAEFGDQVTEAGTWVRRYLGRPESASGIRCHCKDNSVRT